MIFKIKKIRFFLFTSDFLMPQITLVVPSSVQAYNNLSFSCQMPILP